MTDRQIWEFTCKKCGGHALNVTRTFTILAGLESETWQEWGALEANHHWHFEFKEEMDKEGENDDVDDENEKVEGVEIDDDDDPEEGDFGEFSEDDSSSEPEEYEVFEQQTDAGGDELYVNCASCDREIEFGWSKLNRGGLIYPVECSDFVSQELWPEPRYLDSWNKKHWLRSDWKSKELI